jgi:hypothetical protein
MCVYLDVAGGLTSDSETAGNLEDVQGTLQWEERV